MGTRRGDRSPREAGALGRKAGKSPTTVKLLWDSKSDPGQRCPRRTAHGKRAGRGTQQKPSLGRPNDSRNSLSLQLEQKTLDLNIYPISSPMPPKRMTRHKDIWPVPSDTSTGNPAFLHLPSRSGGSPSARARYWPSRYPHLWASVASFVKCSS